MRKISVPDEGAESLFGNFDENLKHLEGLFGVRIRTSGRLPLVTTSCPDRGPRPADRESLWYHSNPFTTKEFPLYRPLP